MSFAVILFLLTLLCGVIALADRWCSPGARGGVAEPWWVEYPKSFFPCCDRVLLRSFVASLQDPVLVDAAHARGGRLHPGQ